MKKMKKFATLLVAIAAFTFVAASCATTSKHGCHYMAKHNSWRTGTYGKVSGMH